MGQNHSKRMFSEVRDGLTSRPALSKKKTKEHIKIYDISCLNSVQVTIKIQLLTQADPL